MSMKLINYHLLCFTFATSRQCIQITGPLI